MPKTLKRNAVLIFVLAVLFYEAFMFAKHAPALRHVIPFGEDPYDAVGSYGVVVGGLIAALSMFRAFRPYGERPPSMAQRVYLLRAQTAVVLIVWITIAADTVAMVRHPSMWVNAPSRNELIAVLGGLALFSVAVQVIIRNSQEKWPERVLWGRGAMFFLIAMAILAFYPEQLIQRITTHLLTVVIGDCVLFAPIGALLPALVPYVPDATANRRRTLSARARWGIVLVLGVLIGAALFIGEMSEGGGPSGIRLAFVAAVFVGLGAAGLLIAYAFLEKPLGFGLQ